MNEEANDPSGDATDAELDNPVLDNPESNDDNSIRELLAQQLESDDQPEVEAESPDKSEENGAESPTVEDDVIAPPQSWTAEEQQAWQDLPDSVRDAIQRTEKAHSQAIRSDAELQKVIEPLAEQLNGTGVHVDQYVSGLLKADRFIDTNPLQAVQTLIQKYNLQDQLNLPANEAPAHAQSSESPDRIAQLEQQIHYQAEVAAETTKWNAFTAEHPDAPQYAEVIAIKIQANPSLTYEGAYNEAKELVSTLAKNDPAAQEAARINGQTAAANKANKLNLPRGKTGVSAPLESTGSVLDDVKAAARQAGLKIN